MHVFAKLFEDRLERGLKAQALSGREIGGDDDVLNFFVGHLVDVRSDEATSVVIDRWLGATGLCEPDLHVFAKLFEYRLEWGLETEAFSRREIGSDDDVLDFFVGHFVDVDLTRQPSS